MTRSIPALAALLALAACDGASAGPADGPLELGIVAGNHQVATAGDDRLSDPVVGKMVRTPGGGIAFHLVTPAYAQDGTVVTGSPVPGAVVCAVSVTQDGLVPFTPCTNTAADGTATFFFSPGTRAGEAKSEIRGVVEGQPAVFDTAVAEVQPGPYVGGYNWGEVRTHEPGSFVADSLMIHDEYGNPIPFCIRPVGGDSVISVPSAPFGSEECRTITWSAERLAANGTYDGPLPAVLSDGTTVVGYYHVRMVYPDITLGLIP